MKGYPQWFNEYYPPAEPSEPIKPREKLEVFAKLKTIYIYDGSTIKLPELIEEFGSNDIWLSFEMDYNYDCYEASLLVREIKLVDNPQYAKEMTAYEKALVKYNKDLETHKSRLEEYKVLQAKLTASKAAKKKTAELAQLAKLKKKYEGN